MDFQQYEIIKSFRKIIYTGKITSYNADKDQSHLLHNSLDFIKETKTRDIEKIYYKRYYWKHRCILWRHRNGF